MGRGPTAAFGGCSADIWWYGLGQLPTALRQLPLRFGGAHRMFHMDRSSRADATAGKDA